MVDRAVRTGSTGISKRFAVALLALAASALLLTTASSASAAVLYEQSDTTGFGITSQLFEPSKEEFSSQLADDFVVPAGETWNIKEVSFKGSYSSSGTADAFNLYFYNNDGPGGLPGTLAALRFGNPYIESAGEFTASFSNPVGLKSGTYWLSVQALQNFETDGQWYWNERAVQSNQEAVWQNPGGGFGGSCTTWGKKSSCAALFPTGPDQAFALKGTKPQGTYIAEASTGALTAGTTDIGNHCDDCTTAIALPFAVNFYNETFFTATVNSNGSLEFGGVSAALSGGEGCKIPDPNLPGALMAYQGDLRTDGPGEGVFSTVVGDPGHRTFILEWRAHYFGAEGTANFEIQLHEDSPVLTVIYGATADSGKVERSGVQASGGGPSTQFSCSTATLTSGLRVDYLPNPHTLTVAKAGSGSGSVTSSPQALNCGSVCSRNFYGGQMVTLTATPSGGAQFTGWSGGGCSGTGTCTVQMDADKSVTATFTQPVPPAPDTVITKSKINQDKHSAKFKFQATGTSTGFECELIKPKVKGAKTKKPRFAGCKSPKTYKNLKPGKYTFKARAVGPGGTDATPAKKVFRIKP